MLIPYDKNVDDKEGSQMTNKEAAPFISVPLGAEPTARHELPVAADLNQHSGVFTRNVLAMLVHFNTIVINRGCDPGHQCIKTPSIHTSNNNASKFHEFIYLMCYIFIYLI